MDMTGTSPLRSRAALLALVAAAVLLVTGVAVVATMARGGPMQTDRKSDSFTGIRQVRVDVDSGDLDIEATAGDATTVTGELRWNTYQRPEFSMTRSGTTLTVNARGCGSTAFRTCETRTAMTVPASVDLVLHSDSGDVVVAGVSGPVELDIDSGNGRLRDLSGPVTVTVDSGDISGTGLSSARARVEVDSGNVTLEFKSQPSQVTLIGDSSDLTVLVPRESGPYSVRAETDSGDTTVDVAKSIDSPNRIEILNDSGNVTVGYLTS